MTADKTITLYHNPRCSKSRETLALLRERGVEPDVVEYLKTPPTADDVRRLVKQLGVAPHDILRTNEAPYKELGLSKESTLDEIAEAVAAHPILLQRPIAVRGDKAAMGRPPENVLPLL